MQGDGKLGRYESTVRLQLFPLPASALEHILLPSARTLIPMLVCPRSARTEEVALVRVEAVTSPRAGVRLFDLPTSRPVPLMLLAGLVPHRLQLLWFLTLGATSAAVKPLVTLLLEVARQVPPLIVHRSVR